jgi:hypothetical protein
VGKSSQRPRRSLSGSAITSRLEGGGAGARPVQAAGPCRAACVPGYVPHASGLVRHRPVLSVGAAPLKDEDRDARDVPLPATVPRTGGFATLMSKEDIDYAIRVFHEMEGSTSCRCELRFEPELGWPDGHPRRKARTK